MDSEFPLLKKLESASNRYHELAEAMSDPESMADMKRFVQINKEYKDLESIHLAYQEYASLVAAVQEARSILRDESDPEMLEMARQELDEATRKVAPLEERVRLLLVPSEPEDAKNAILEIRAGTGGDEASLFAGDLYRMYAKFCDAMGWKVSVTSMTEGTMGGYKEIIMEVEGQGVYGLLKYESGVHRVQRVPQTEAQGRVHTSAATVAVLPEAEEFDVELRKEDIRRDEFCSSGAGGQSVNTTYSAVRLTHLPTGIVVQCQDQKSKLKNIEKAMVELRTRIFNLEYQRRMDELSSKRKTMVSTGDRSAKIRTYNFPQGRVTDHRVNLTLYNLAAIMNGEIGEIIEKLQFEENSQKLLEMEV